MVRSYSRRTGEHSFIYARNDGKDLKLLIVNVQPNEAAVIQVKLDPEKFEKFIDENAIGGTHRQRSRALSRFPESPAPH